MDLPKLFSIVHELSRNQRANFTRFSKGRENSSMLLLYRRIKKEIRIDDQAIKRIRGREFKSSSKFLSVRLGLADLIIRSVVHYEYQAVPVLQYVKKAYLLGAKQIACERLKDEVDRLTALEEFSDLLKVLEFIEELQLFYNIGIEVTQLPTRDYLLHQLNQRFVLYDLYKRVKGLVHADFEERGYQAKWLATQIPDDCESRFNDDFAQKLRMNLCFFTGEYQKAFCIGKDLVCRIKDWPEKYPPSALARELRVLGLHAISLRDKNLAVDYIFEVSLVHGETKHEIEQLAEGMLRLKCALSAVFAEESIARQNIKILRENISVSKGIALAKLHYECGMAFFFNHKYNDAVRCFLETRNLVSKDDVALKWEPQLLISICSAELGYYDSFTSFIRSASYCARKLPGKFPQFTISIVKEYYRNPQDCDVDFWEKKELMLSLITTEKNEKSASNYLPIRIWIDSKKSGISQKSVIDTLNRDTYRKNFPNSRV